MYMCYCWYILGTFHLTNNSAFNFFQCFLEIPEEKDNLTECTQFFINFWPGISVPFDIFPKFKKFSDEGLQIENMTIFQFSGKFPRKFPYHLPLVREF